MSMATASIVAAGQPLRVAVLARRERDLGLAHRTAHFALQARHLQLDPHRALADRKPPEPALTSASADDLLTLARRALQLRDGLLNPEANLASNVLGPLVDIAVHAERVIQ
jgi:hypothetical protein